MKNTKFTCIARLFAASVLTLAGSSVFAATTWNLDCGMDGVAVTVASNNCSAGATNVLTLSAFSTGSGAGATATSAGTNFAAASIYDWGAGAGLGIVATNETTVAGPHAADNAFGTDAFQFKFASAVNLQSLTVGWNGTDNPATTSSVTYNDSDLSVFAWIGNGTAPTFTGATTTANLITAVSPGNVGWKLVGNFTNVGSSNGAIAGGTQAFTAKNLDNTTTLYSSYWLISAFNSSYGSGDTNVDAFKLLAVAGDTCTQTVNNNKCGGNSGQGGTVPEPGSMALVGAGVMGLLVTRRQKNKEKAA